jgi:hypothetical protein
MTHMERILNSPMGPRRWATHDAAWLAATRRQRRWEILGSLCPALALAAGFYVFVYPTVAATFDNLIAGLTITLPH